jgi:hypothetical protein
MIMTTDLFRTIAANAKVAGMSIGVHKFVPQLDELQIDDRLKKLFSRIENIRQLNYRGQTNLEADQIKAVELWASIEPSVKEKIESGVETYRKETKALELELDWCTTSASEPQGDSGKLATLEKWVDAYKAKVTFFIGQTKCYIVNLLSLLVSIEQRVSTAETALDLTSMASFKLKEDEALIIALKAKDMNKKIEGLLIFTNQRMIYESVTSKKTERQLLLERPVSSVAKITQDSVGMFEPEGLYVEFKQPSDPKLKLATKFHGGEADLAVQYFGMIVSGQIDDELKSGISVTVRKRFKELAASYFPGDSFCFGRCKECGTVVSSLIKNIQWMEG